MDGRCAVELEHASFVIISDAGVGYGYWSLRTGGGGERRMFRPLYYDLSDSGSRLQYIDRRNYRMRKQRESYFQGVMQNGPPDSRGRVSVSLNLQVLGAFHTHVGCLCRSAFMFRCSSLLAVLLSENIKSKT